MCLVSNSFASSFQRADLAMADLTINYQREMVVDFTMPFLDLGMTNDFSKSTTIVPTHRSFISELRNRLI